MKRIIDKHKWTNNEIIYYLISLLIILFYFSPYFIWGQDCIIEIGDNLDGNIPYFKILAENAHKLGWNYEVVPQVMNGLPKSSFLPQWNIITLLFYFFSPFIAYSIHLILMSLIAFIGMLLLLKHLWSDTDSVIRNVIIFGTALGFSLLDFYPSSGISIAGQPLLLYAFMNISSGKINIRYFVIILLFPFYSSIVFAGVFIFIILGVWGAYKIVFDRKYLLFFILAGILLLISYLFTEQALIFNYLNKDAVTITDAQGINSFSFFVSLKVMLKLLVYGLPSHANVFMFPALLVSIFFAGGLSVYKKYSYKNPFYIVILFILVFSFLSAFSAWSFLDPLKMKISFLRSFDFSRFSFFLPILFYIAFFYSLKIIKDFHIKSIYLVSFLLLVQVGFVIKRNGNNKTLYYEIHKIYSYDRKTNQELSFKEYYSEKLFIKIKDYISIPASDYRVLGLGIEPSVLLYNGFYTLDGYNSNYPTSYYNDFRKIIEKEIDKSELIRSDFDGEGSLCYLFSEELIRATKYTKLNSIEINKLEINTEQIKNMGGTYIISAVKVNNADDLNIKIVNKFEDPESLYIIYLYKII